MLIEYAYTGQIRITEGNVLAIFLASGILRMVEIRTACSKFLMERMSPTNCLGIRKFAEIQSGQDLYQYSCDYVLKRFPAVIDTEEFLDLPFEKINELISNDQLTTYSEEEVYKAVMKWLKHNLESRKTFFSKLVQRVRLPLIRTDFLMDIIDNEKLFEENLECRLLIHDATKYHLRNSEPPESLQRLPKPIPYIFVTGGTNGSGGLSECDVINPTSNTYTSIPPMLETRKGCSATNLGRYIFVAGGCNSNDILETVECYDPLTNSWSSQTSMKGKRSYFGICTLDTSIYVCGGAGGNYLNSMERFDSVKGIWTACPEMNSKRCGCKLAEIENTIYAVGGWDPNQLSVVEKFDPRENKWTQVPSMSQARGALGVAVLNNELYCVGGVDVSSGEKFNARRNAWEPIGNMNSKRWGHEVVAVGDFLYAIGGREYTGSLIFNSVEQYDPQTDNWSTEMLEMKTERWHFGAAVLECFNLEQLLEPLKSDSND